MGFVTSQTSPKAPSMSASARQMDVSSGIRIVFRMSAKISAVGPVALASSSAVTGS
jgi:hypothetical protein